MILPLLLAAAAAAAPSACPRQAVGARETQKLAITISRATHQRVRPADIGHVLQKGSWRLVWATPDAAERGVFFLRRDTIGAWRYADVWGGVIAPDERAGTIRWAQQRGGDFPPALAACFADALLAGK